MLGFYFIFIILFILGFFYENLKKWQDKIVVSFIGFFLLLFLFGLRYHVGIDWFNYVLKFQRVAINSDYLASGEVLYNVINIASNSLGFGYQGVVFFTTLVFLALNFYACYLFKINVFYFLLICSPVFIFLVLFNLTRQSIAISALLCSIYFILKGDNKRFLIFIFLGSGFHISCIFFVSIIFIRMSKLKIFFIFGIFSFFLGLVVFMRYGRYLDGDIVSHGYMLRIMYLIYPFFVFLVYRKYLNNISTHEKRLYLIAFYSFPALFVLSLYSTVMADRISYYFIVLSTFLLMVFLRYKVSNAFLYRFFCTFNFLTLFFLWSLWFFLSDNSIYYHFNHLFFMYDSSVFETLKSNYNIL